MALTFKSLDAASSDTVGDVFSFNQPRSTISVQVINTGNPSQAQYALQGSIDGINFHNLLGFNAPFEGGIFSSTGKPVVAVRVNVGTLSSGTVTAWIAVDQ